MLDWITQHGEVLNLALNIGMFVVWVVYLQLFLMTYLRARKPRILISRGAEADVDALCLVSNMSQEPFYPQDLYCTLHTKDASYTAPISDRAILRNAGKEEHPDGVVSHGPLGQGDFRSVGAFRNMISLTASRAEGCPDSLEDIAEDITSVEIMVIGAFGGDDLEIAARRCFRVDAGQQPWKLVPTTPETRQVSSRRERHEIRRMIERELEKA